MAGLVVWEVYGLVPAFICCQVSPEKTSAVQNESNILVILLLGPLK